MSRPSRGLAAAIVCAVGAATLFAVPSVALAADEPLGIRVNEVVSSGGSPDDWIEFYNYSHSAVDLGGYLVQDDSDKNPYAFPAGTVVAPGEYLVIDTLSDDGAGDFDFGLGKGDSVRVFAPGDANGVEPLLQVTWPADTHAAPSWGAQESDGELTWALTAESTKGAANVFADDAPAEPETPVDGSVVINEIDSQPADWVELYNPGGAALDLSGYELRDNSDDHRWTFLEGASIAAGGFLVVEEDTIGLVDGVETAFRAPIGIGSTDRMRLFDPSGALVDDTLPWEGHAAIDGDFAAATFARCPDGQGAFVLARPTPGSSNVCAAPDVVINEIESNGDATDWVEILNVGTTTVDISDWSVMDADPAGHADETTPLPAGTELAPGAYYVFDQPNDFVFGLGGADTVTVRDANGATVDEHIYTAHAKGVWARCANGSGDFIDASVSTKGAANSCEGIGDDDGEQAPEASPWPGSAEVRVIDELPVFLEDSSGLDIQQTADGVFLWAVDNGEGRIWKLEASADGSVAIIDGWADGKRVRFQKDAADPSAAGPDTEGITVDGDGLVYVASERDNNAKGVNENTVLQIDPDEAGPDLIALNEWDLTAQLPAVGANLGIEAVEWVSDDVLAGSLYDDTTRAAYDPSTYAGKGDGLFFVAVEDTGDVYAFALGLDGSSQLVSTIDPGLAGVMSLDYDSVLGVLWAMCDDGCQGRSAQITLNGTSDVDIAHFARPAGLPDINNEGFATAPASLVVDGQRPVWWFADGYASEALRTGTLNAGDDGGAGEVPGDGDAGSGDDGTDAGGDAGAGSDDGADAGGDAGAGDDGAGSDDGTDAGGDAGAGDDGTDAGGDAGAGDDGAGSVDDGTDAGGDAGAGDDGAGSDDGADAGGDAGAGDDGAGSVDDGTDAGGDAGSGDDGTDAGDDGAGSDDGTDAGGDAGAGDAGTGSDDGTDSGEDNGSDESPGSDDTDTGTAPDGADGDESTDASVVPLPGASLVDGNRGGATVSDSVVAPGDQVTITLGAAHAGADVEVWMYSDPVFLAAGTLDGAGAIAVRIPTDATTGAHRLAVYSADGALLGWVSIHVDGGAALATTGSEIPIGGAVLALGLLLAGAIAVTLRRRGERV